MNTKLRARIDSLLGEFDKLAEKRCDEYMKTHGNPENEGAIREAIRAMQKGKADEFFDKHKRKVILNRGDL